MYEPEPLPAIPHTFSQAIARMEGWYIRGTEPNRPQRNNNPGDLDFAAWQVSYGAVLETDPWMPARFSRFPDAATGWTALRSLLAGPLYANLCVRDAINRYAPSNENNTTNYVVLVCEWCDCQPETPISEVL